MESFLLIWFSPRKAQSALSKAYLQDADVNMLLIAAGIAATLGRALDRPHDKLELGSILGISFFVAVIHAVPYTWLMSFLVSRFGGFLGGVADTEAIRRAIAIASVPMIVGLPMWVPCLWLYGVEPFHSSTPTIEANPFPFLGMCILWLVLWIWSSVAMIKTTAEAMGFGAWKSLFAWILSYAIGAVVVLTLVWQLGLFKAPAH